MARKDIVAAVAFLLMAGLAASATAQTLTDTVTDGAADAFFFSLADPGQARFTVTWDDAPDVLALLVGCDSEGGTLNFITSVPDQDRILSADVGVLPDLDCLAVVDIFVGLTTPYAINLQVTSPGDNVLEMAQLRPLTEDDAANPRLMKLADDLKRRAQALRALR